jgi:opacity protein-like surface antigen
MKKIMMIAAMMLLSVGAFAQGKMAIGANAGMAFYGNEYNPFGVGAKFQYEFVESFRAELAYNYWFPKDKAGIMDIDLNFHYLIPVGEGINVYPIVGVNLGMTHGEAYKDLFDGQESIFGFQGGVGIEYYLSSNLKVNLDAKYQYNKKNKDYSVTYMGSTYSTEYELKYDGPVIQAGIAYVF